MREPDPCDLPGEEALSAFINTRQFPLHRDYPRSGDEVVVLVFRSRHFISWMCTVPPDENARAWLIPTPGMHDMPTAAKQGACSMHISTTRGNRINRNGTAIRHRADPSGCGPPPRVFFPRRISAPAAGAFPGQAKERVVVASDVGTTIAEQVIPHEAHGEPPFIDHATTFTSTPQFHFPSARHPLNARTFRAGSGRWRSRAAGSGSRPGKPEDAESCLTSDPGWRTTPTWTGRSPETCNPAWHPTGQMKGAWFSPQRSSRNSTARSSGPPERLWTTSCETHRRPTRWNKWLLRLR